MIFGTVTKAKVSLCKCADSSEPSLLAKNSIKSPLEPVRDFLTVPKAQTRSSQTTPMLYTKSQGHQPSGSGEEDF